MHQINQLDSKENKGIQADAAYYQSRQWVKLLWVMLPLLTLGVALFDGRHLALPQLLRSLLLIAIINLFALSIFGHLTIKLNAQDLRWHFGFFSWPKWQLKLADIVHVEVCQTLWFEGKGIRFTKEGMLYNADGNGAIRITKADGKKIRIGSAEPEILCAQLQLALSLKK